MTAAKYMLGLVCILTSVHCGAQAVVGGTDDFFAPLDATRSIPVSIVDATDSPLSAAYSADAELALWALQDWSRALDGEFRFHVVDDENEALIAVQFVGPGAGQYGEMAPINVNGKRGAAVFVRPDTNALGQDIASRSNEDPLFRETVVYLTCLHELGHALGLSHTADYSDIMYAFGFGGDIEEYFMRYRRLIAERADIAAQTGLSQSDVARIRMLYSGILQ